MIKSKSYISNAFLAVALAFLVCGCSVEGGTPVSSAEEAVDWSAENAASIQEGLDTLMVEVGNENVELWDTGGCEIQSNQKTLDKFGNVVQYTRKDGSAESQTFIMEYDNYGIPVACTGDAEWTQEVTERDDEGRPAAVARVRADGSATYFAFTYSESGGVVSYEIDAPSSFSRYTLDEEGRIIDAVTVATEDHVAVDAEEAATTSYALDPSGTVEIAMTSSQEGLERSAIYSFGEDGLPTQCNIKYPDSLAVESVSYAAVESPSEMVRLWSSVFYRTNPLTVPVF